MEDIYKIIDLNDCPICGGAGLLDEEKGSGYNVTCMDCGSYSVHVNFANEEERLIAARKTAQLWNSGKVISSNVGE